MLKRVSHRVRAASRRARRATLAAAVLAVACETPPPPETRTESPTPAPVATAPTPWAVMPAAPSEPDAAPAGEWTDAELAARTEPSPPVIDSDPRRLLKMDSEALADLLGQPAFIRNDAPAQLWRYRHESCVLDVFLYVSPDSPRRRLAVRHVVARNAEHGAVPADQCLREILLARMRGISG